MSSAMPWAMLAVQPSKPATATRMLRVMRMLRVI